MSPALFLWVRMPMLHKPSVRYRAKLASNHPVGSTRMDLPGWAAWVMCGAGFTEDRAHIGPGPCCGYHIGDGYFYLWGYHHQMDLQTSTLRAPTLSLLGGKRGGDVAMPPHHTIPIIAFDPQNLSYRHSSGGIIFVPPRVSRTATFGPKRLIPALEPHRSWETTDYFTNGPRQPPPPPPPSPPLPSMPIMLLPTSRLCFVTLLTPLTPIAAAGTGWALCRDLTVPLVIRLEALPLCLWVAVELGRGRGVDGVSFALAGYVPCSWYRGSTGFALKIEELPPDLMSKNWTPLHWSTGRAAVLETSSTNDMASLALYKGTESGPLLGLFCQGNHDLLEKYDVSSLRQQYRRSCLALDRGALIAQSWGKYTISSAFRAGCLLPSIVLSGAQYRGQQCRDIPMIRIIGAVGHASGSRQLLINDHFGHSQQYSWNKQNDEPVWGVACFMLQYITKDGLAALQYPSRAVIAICCPYPPQNHARECFRCAADVSQGSEKEGTVDTTHRYHAERLGRFASGPRSLEDCEPFKTIQNVLPTRALLLKKSTTYAGQNIHLTKDEQCWKTGSGCLDERRPIWSRSKPVIETGTASFHRIVQLLHRSRNRLSNQLMKPVTTAKSEGCSACF
ncbi:uncharacterized protein BO96DRAFT_361729 [Aspergillus niger CBS 101883]|uniref:uncharacterized protein n=1 Tax=Aspergillus lacticoffeatus (strain CBS 101883) TaxID=1450533 RepID=UPI000D7FD249|nr:uncharacterized protein BO96DRAFT_361729 [Aspergillus niger CBS 101883]PYH58893.1 hypothetical protein BO96DRAFT_361729 [Aspergillus niger CBS 101883]